VGQVKNIGKGRKRVGGGLNKGEVKGEKMIDISFRVPYVTRGEKVKRITE
jgi:hypothetical protein